MPSKKVARIPARWRKAVLGFAVICLATAAMLLAARQPSPSENHARVETSITAVEALAPVAEPTAQRRAPRTRAKPVAASVGKTRSAAAPMANSAVGSLLPSTGPKPAAMAAAAAQGEAATIIGCLELDDETFRLKDTEGDEAPKARSWKSGFLRRSNTAVEVVDVADRLRLSTHVGHRISLTGTLIDREIQARSVKMVAASCDD
jgi:hypothetical protein